MAAVASESRSAAARGTRSGGNSPSVPPSGVIGGGSVASAVVSSPSGTAGGSTVTQDEDASPVVVESTADDGESADGAGGDGRVPLGVPGEFRAVGASRRGAGDDLTECTGCGPRYSPGEPSGDVDGKLSFVVAKRFFQCFASLARSVANVVFEEGGCWFTLYSRELLVGRTLINHPEGPTVVRPSLLSLLMIGITCASIVPLSHLNK